MFKKNYVKVILVVVCGLIVFSGCALNHQTDEGGKGRMTLGLIFENESTPSSSSIVWGGKTSESIIIPVAESFNASRGEVQKAKALQNKVTHEFEGIGNFNVNSSVSKEAERLINGGQKIR